MCRILVYVSTLQFSAAVDSPTWQIILMKQLELYLLDKQHKQGETMYNIQRAMMACILSIRTTSFQIRHYNDEIKLQTMTVHLPMGYFSMQMENTIDVDNTLTFKTFNNIGLNSGLKLK